jgi:hypothetical protein
MLIPCPGTAARGLYDRGKVQINALTDHIRRTKAGKPSADPLSTTKAHWLKQLDDLGLTATGQGNIVSKDDAAAKTDPSSGGKW